MIKRRHVTATQNRLALYSECGRYRYLLGIRSVEVRSRGAALLPFIGLNPSTATEREDDATIRRCMGFARKWGYAGIQMANLAAFRATNPREMLAAEDPIGPENTVNFLRGLLERDGASEAHCPRCAKWFRGHGDDRWWREGGACPGCGARVVAELELRLAPSPGGAAVACWGIRGGHSRLLAQNAAVRSELRPWLHALGLTSNREPLHPLYLPLDTELRRLSELQP